MFVEIVVWVYIMWYGIGSMKFGKVCCFLEVIFNNVFNFELVGVVVVVFFYFYIFFVLFFL